MTYWSRDKAEGVLHDQGTKTEWALFTDVLVKTKQTVRYSVKTQNWERYSLPYQSKQKNNALFIKVTNNIQNWECTTQCRNNGVNELTARYSQT